MRKKPLERQKIRVKKDDLVVVIAGKDAGKRGKVLEVLRDRGRVVVQGVGFIKRHTRPNPQRNIKGGIAEREAAIHASNVMIVAPEDDKRSRIGSKVLADGRKVRISRRTGEILDIFDYPFILLWGLPFGAILAAWLAERLSMRGLAYTCVTIPVLMHGTIFAWFYLAPPEWR